MVSEFLEIQNGHLISNRIAPSRLVLWEMPGRIPWCRMRLGCSGRNQGLGMVADVAQVYSGRRMSGATWGWLSEVRGTS